MKKKKYKQKIQIKDKNGLGWKVPIIVSLLTFAFFLVSFFVLLYLFGPQPELTTKVIEINKTFLEGIIIP